jgi:hypothetical protein
MVERALVWAVMTLARGKEEHEAQEEQRERELLFQPLAISASSVSFIPCMYYPQRTQAISTVYMDSPALYPPLPLTLAPSKTLSSRGRPILPSSLREPASR